MGGPAIALALSSTFELLPPYPFYGTKNESASKTSPNRGRRSVGTKRQCFLLPTFFLPQVRPLLKGPVALAAYEWVNGQLGHMMNPIGEFPNNVPLLLVADLGFILRS